MIRNQLEIRVCGLQRCGNHAIIDWIIQQFKGRRVCFLNNVHHGDQDPFSSAAQVFAYGIEGIPDGRVKEPSESLKTTEKDVLIYSYEDSAGRMLSFDSFLGSVYRPEFYTTREQYLGGSDRSVDILLLRDPYNFFASRIKKMEDRTGVKDVPTIIHYWKEMAEAALAMEEAQDPNKLFVGYNQWFADKKYRQNLCDFLGGTYSDESLGKVNPMGKGSSFDKTSVSKTLTPSKIAKKWYKFFDPRSYTRIPLYLNQMFGARRMKVMDRWKVLKDDGRMDPVFTDAELARLSNEIFGKIL